MESNRRSEKVTVVGILSFLCGCILLEYLKSDQPMIWGGYIAFGLMAFGFITFLAGACMEYSKPMFTHK